MTTEREEFEEWWYGTTASEENESRNSAFEGWLSGRAPLLKRIEELEADKEEYLSMKRECTNENCCC